VSGLRLNLVELGHSGHHAGYLRHLVRAWPEFSGAQSMLRITATPGLASAHPDLVRALDEQRVEGVELQVLDPRIADDLEAAARPDRIPLSWLIGSGPPGEIFSRKAWDVAQRSAREFGADQLVFMEVDPVLPAVAAHLPAACRFSGIWFGPARGSASPSERRWALDQGLLVRRALGHPDLLQLFCLDPAATDQLTQRLGATPLSYLPDPVTIPVPVSRSARMAIRARLGIPGRNQALLFFGQLATRKGLREILAAVEALSRERLARLSLLVAGPTLDIDLAELREKAERLRRLGTHVVVLPEFTTDEVAEDLFRACDAVLAIYRNHVGMSGVMLRAAAHGRPVLSQSYGLMGELCRRHRLGLTVDVDDPASLGSVLAAASDGEFGSGFDPTAAALFAQSHDVREFCRSFYMALGLSSRSRAATAGQSMQA